MPVTVGDILRIPGLALTLVAGKRGAANHIRWVHVSELADPTPWLKGGELLLTTGMGTGKSAAAQRAYLRRLTAAGLSGLGVGLGFSHRRIPKALAVAAEEAEFPLFEVPYPVPFIAITEAVFTRLLSEQYELLQRSVEIQNALTRAVLDETGVEGIAASLAQAVGGWVLLLDLHGRRLASTSRAAQQRVDLVWRELHGSRASGAGFSMTLVDGGHHLWIQPVGAHGRVEAFLAVGKPQALTQLDRIVASHALSLFAIELAKGRAVAEAERKLRGDLLQSVASGTLPAKEVARSLARFGFQRDQEVVALAVEGGPPDDLAWAAEDLFSRMGGAFLVSPDPQGVHVLVQADLDLDLTQVGKELADRVGDDVLVGAGGHVAPHESGRSLREARYALKVCRLEGWPAAGFGDLGSYRLLLSMTEPEALRAFADSLLAPLDAYDAEGGGELLVSLRAFLQHNARWETAAAELFVHRHTLRYRIRKIEELTGRDLSSSFDRMEFWLALRARELRSAQAEP